jgi:hypothetical protein
MTDDELATTIALMQRDIRDIKKDIEEICKGKENFVTKLEFNLQMTPLQRLVYGAVGVILLTFMASVIGLVLTKVH